MTNIRDFKTKEEGEYRVCKLKTALKNVNGDLFYICYLTGRKGIEDYLDVVTSSPAVYCEVWKKQYRRVSVLEAEEDLKHIEKRLKLMEVDKVTLTINDEDMESLRISLEQSKAGIGVPFDLDDYIGCNDNIFKDTPIFKAIPFDAGGCSLQELYGAPEHNAQEGR